MSFSPTLSLILRGLTEHTLPEHVGGGGRDEISYCINPPIERRIKKGNLIYMKTTILIRTARTLFTTALISAFAVCAHADGTTPAKEKTCSFPNRSFPSQVWSRPHARKPRM